MYDSRNDIHWWAGRRPATEGSLRGRSIHYWGCLTACKRANDFEWLPVVLSSSIMCTKSCGDSDHKKYLIARPLICSHPLLRHSTRNQGPLNSCFINSINRLNCQDVNHDLFGITSSQLTGTSSHLLKVEITTQQKIKNHNNYDNNMSFIF